jgi:hypothetical protein
LPSLASPQTWKECQSRSSRIVIRAPKWSSTIRIRADNQTPMRRPPHVEETKRLGHVGHLIFAVPFCLFNRGKTLARWSYCHRADKRSLPYLLLNALQLAPTALPAGFHCRVPIRIHDITRYATARAGSPE